MQRTRDMRAWRGGFHFDASDSAGASLLASLTDQPNQLSKKPGLTQTLLGFAARESAQWTAPAAHSSAVLASAMCNTFGPHR